jgi:hypothetical protein
VGQDGAQEGVFGRAFDRSGPQGEEIQLNTSGLSKQLYPAIASAGDDYAVVTWTSFIGGAESFDIFAQRMSAVPDLAAPSAPFVFALSPAELSVTWPEVSGLDVAAYRLFINGSTTPVEVQGNQYTLTDLNAGSKHTFRLGYRLADGRLSPASGEISGQTWGLDRNWDGLPDDWQGRFWPGVNAAAVIGRDADPDGDGAGNLAELLAGTDPTDAQSVLKNRMESDPQGIRLVWNVQPGGLYQVQVSTDLGSWADYGTPRLAAGTTDSVSVPGSKALLVYRVIRIR